MTRYNYNPESVENLKFAEALDVHVPARRRGRATAAVSGTTFAVSNFPAFAGATIVGAGTAAANADVAGGSAIVSVTGVNSGDSNNIVSATNLTRRDWNPWIRFRWFMPTVAQCASYRTWIGVYNSDPSALATLATLSAACFGFDTVVDGVFSDGVSRWRCETGNTATAKLTTTDMPIVAAGSYTGEIRMDTANARIDFYMAFHGTSASPKVQSPLRLVASHASSVPVATTNLLVGATATVLPTTPLAKRVIIASVELSHD